MPNAATIEGLDAHQLIGEIEALAGILHACVADGASVGFIRPFSLDEARAYWHKVAKALAANESKLLVTRVDGKVAGTVQLHLAMPANGRHRAEVAKLLVHPAARRQGIGRSLMDAVERLAVAERRGLLVLDMRAGDNAERLYRALGWQTAGIIPQYALSTTGILCGTTVMFKTFGIEDVTWSI